MRSQGSNFKTQGLLVIIVLTSLALPLFSLADGCYQTGDTNVYYKGFVPCGKQVPDAGESLEVTLPCQLCHFLVMFQGIFEFLLFRLSWVVLALLIVIAGLLFFLAGGIEGMPETYEKAKRILTSGIYGILIMFGAWVFLNLFFSIIGVADWTGLTTWWQINCPITIPDFFYAALNPNQQPTAPNQPAESFVGVNTPLENELIPSPPF